MTTYIVIRQNWLESELGLGTRPDGYSIHLSEQDRKAYVAEYWKGMPEETPDEYSRPEGGPVPFEVQGDVYEKVKSTKYGLRFFR